MSGVVIVVVSSIVRDRIPAVDPPFIVVCRKQLCNQYSRYVQRGQQQNHDNTAKYGKQNNRPFTLKAFSHADNQYIQKIPISPIKPPIASAKSTMQTVGNIEIKPPLESIVSKSSIPKELSHRHKQPPLPV